jgi:hypothetical protein
MSGRGWTTSRETRQQKVEALELIGEGRLQFDTFLGISLGIKQRMIDIGKKNPFTFSKMFENVQFFLVHLHLKVCKKCYYDPNNFFRKKYQYDVRNAEFFLISSSLMPGIQKYSKKLKAKTTKKLVKNKNSQNSQFFGCSFF